MGNLEMIPGKAERLPPMLSGGFPLVGHTAEFVRDAIGLLERAYRECGVVVRFRVIGKEMVLLTGPEVQETFFRAPDEQLSQSEAYKMMVPVFGKGVAYDNEPTKMIEQLHMLVPALQGRRMQTYGELISAEVENSITDWGDEGVIDFYQYAQSLTLLTSSHCLLGREFREELTQEFDQAYHHLERSIVPLAYITPYLPIPVFRQRDQARARLGEMVSRVVQRRRDNHQMGEDFLQTLMEARYSDGTSLTTHEITGMLIAAMFAGHRTSAVSLAWTLLELLDHPKVMYEVRWEIDRLFANGQPVTSELLKEANQTEWAVKEAVRLHPPLFMLLRSVEQDFEVLGYQIPKGSWCIVSPWVGQREDRVFAKAAHFEPQRFAPGRAKDMHPFSYISFGGGRHKCLGMSFALLQIKSILAILLRQFDFELYGDPIESDFQGLVVGPKMPCRVRYRRRQLSTNQHINNPPNLP